MRILTRCTALILIFTLLYLPLPAGATADLHIIVLGITGEPLKNVQTRLETTKQLLGSNINHTMLNNFLQSAPENIQSALQPYGYFNAAIKTQLTRQGQQWQVQFFIRPGPPVRIQQIMLTVEGPGKDDDHLKKFLTDFPLHKGQVFQVEVYEKANEALLHLITNRGYVRAALTSREVRVDKQKNTCQIRLHVHTGNQYYLGPVTFNTSTFAEHFLRRFILFDENTPFSSELLLKQQQDLLSSHYFEHAQIEPDLENTRNNRVPITIRLTPLKAREYNAGIGYGTFTGPRLTLGGNWRQLGHEGQHVASELKLSSIRKGFAAMYVTPGKNPLTDQYNIGVNYQILSPNDDKSTSETLSMGYVKQIQQWQINPVIKYRMEHSNFDQQQTTISHFLLPGITLSRIKADDFIYPRHGSMITLHIQGATKTILSTATMAQIELKGKYVCSPTDQSRVILYGNLGYSIVNNAVPLPLTLQYFAGGLGSIRGYAYDSLGPGRYLKVGSIEMQHTLAGNWDGAVFYDRGNASDNFKGPTYSATGIGILYKSLIGPVKLYIAHTQLSSHALHIEFSIGPDF